MTTKPPTPTTVQIRRVFAWPSSKPPAASALSQCLSGKNRSQNPSRRAETSAEAASICSLYSRAYGCAFGTGTPPPSSERDGGRSDDARQRLPDRAAKHRVGDAVERRGFRVYDDDARACVLRGGQGACNRIDRQARADRDEQIRLGGSLHRAVDHLGNERLPERNRIAFQ